ncbi:MAG: hypothetical protein KJ826_02145, partial [Proteobacteria bacterium]|nr:hypothetical protein [Pseudomonadota bacterium]
LWVATLIRLRPDYLREPPGADPHAGWCGEGERKTPPYPIRAAVGGELLNGVQLARVRTAGGGTNNYYYELFPNKKTG